MLYLEQGRTIYYLGRSRERDTDVYRVRKTLYMLGIILVPAVFYCFNFHIDF